MANKNMALKGLWPLFRVPALIIVLWNLVAVVVAAVSIDVYGSVFGQWPSMVVMLLVFSFIGYRVVEEAGACCLSAAKAGAWAGAITGFISAIIGVIGVLFVPNILSMLFRRWWLGVLTFHWLKVCI